MSDIELHDMIAGRLDGIDEQLRNLLVSAGQTNDHLKQLNGSVAKHEDRIHSEELVREIMVRDIKELKEEQEKKVQIYSQRSFEIWSKLGWIALGIIGSIVYAVLKKTGVIDF